MPQSLLASVLTAVLGHIETMAVLHMVPSPFPSALCLG